MRLWVCCKFHEHCQYIFHFYRRNSLRALRLRFRNAEWEEVPERLLESICLTPSLEELLIALPDPPSPSASTCQGDVPAVTSPGNESPSNDAENDYPASGSHLTTYSALPSLRSLRLEGLAAEDEAFLSRVLLASSPASIDLRGTSLGPALRHLGSCTPSSALARLRLSLSIGSPEEMPCFDSLSSLVTLEALEVRIVTIKGEGDSTSNRERALGDADHYPRPADAPIQ